ncbi:MAG: hypothetical protein WCP52_11760 [Bacteroidota bacterium]
MIKKINKIFLLGLILIIVSCQTEQEKNTEVIALAQSIANERTEQEQQKKKQEELDGYYSNETDSILVYTDFDRQFISTTRVHFDRNNVEWEDKENNGFRFVYKIKPRKLIVYKNNIEFMNYNYCTTYRNGNKKFTERGTSDISRIYEKSKLIFYRGASIKGFSLGNNSWTFAPKGFENNSEYYILNEDRKND